MLVIDAVVLAFSHILVCGPVDDDMRNATVANLPPFGSVPSPSLDSGLPADAPISVSEQAQAKFGAESATTLPRYPRGF